MLYPSLSLFDKIMANINDPLLKKIFYQKLKSILQSKDNIRIYYIGPYLYHFPFISLITYNFTQRRVNYN